MRIEDLPDEAIVVRGGHKNAAQILRRATKDRGRLGTYGISAFAGWTPETTLAEVVGASGLVFDVVQTSTVGRLRAAGFEIARSFRWPHCTIDLGDDPTEDTAARLVGLFNSPVANPALEVRNDDPNRSGLQQPR